MNTIELLKDKKIKISENDEFILNYIEENLDQIPRISSRELARRTYTTSTAVIRMVRKLRYENYNDFKLHIVSDLKSLNNEDLSVSNEDMLSLMNKISTISAKSIQQFKDTMPVETLNKVVEMLKSTKYIDIIANDFNQSLAEYASHFLCALGKIVNVYDEKDKQLYFSLNVPDDHVVFIISRTFTNKDFFHSLKTLFKRNIKTIVLTIKNDKQIQKYSTYVINNFPYYDSELNDLFFYSTIKYFFDLIFAALVTQNVEHARKLENLYHQMYFDMDEKM